MSSSQNNIPSKIIMAVALVFISSTMAIAGDVVTKELTSGGMSSGKMLDAKLLPEDGNYPDVQLRRQSSQDCYCSGAYFSISSGYTVGNEVSLVKGTPIVVATGDDAPGQPTIVNPGGLNEFVPQMKISGKQYAGSLAAGYKFGNLRVEVSAEYRRQNTISGGANLNGASVIYSARTNQYGTLMSGFYDLDMAGFPIQPYVGLGAGISLNQTKFGVDYDGATSASASIDYSQAFAFTGAAMAGVAINLGDHFTVDLGYRYMQTLGGRASYDGQTDGTAVNTASGVNLVNISGMALATDTGGVVYQETLNYPSMIAHELRAGIRYRF